MQVFDLSDVRPNEFVQYGLGCLEKLAGLGDFCAKDTRDKLRILVINGPFLNLYKNGHGNDAVSWMCVI
jgi:hypothetical protein